MEDIKEILEDAWTNCGSS